MEKVIVPVHDLRANEVYCPSLPHGQNIIVDKIGTMIVNNASKDGIDNFKGTPNIIGIAPIIVELADLDYDSVKIKVDFVRRSGKYPLPNDTIENHILNVNFYIPTKNSLFNVKNSFLIDEIFSVMKDQTSMKDYILVEICEKEIDKNLLTKVLASLVKDKVLIFTIAELNAYNIYEELGFVDISDIINDPHEKNKRLYLYSDNHIGKCFILAVKV